MYHDPSDLKSLILIWIIPKKRTLCKWVEISKKRSTCWHLWPLNEFHVCHTKLFSESLSQRAWFFWLISFNPGCLVLTYNLGQNLLRQIKKLPIFFHYQMNAQFPPSSYPKLFRIAWKLHTLVFWPKQLCIGGGERGYFFGLEETIVVWNCLKSFVWVCRSIWFNSCQEDSWEIA